MSTLLLASSGKWVTPHASQHLPIPLNKASIAYITTASKGVTDTAYIQEHIKQRRELGWNFEEIDIAGMNESSLREAFAGKDVIYAEGGNTFYLMKAIRASGFENVLRELLEQGVIYIGTSAGSYVCSPTIEAATWKHQDKYDHYNVTNLTGMNLIPFLITAHYEPESRSIIEEGASRANHLTRALTDNQAFLVKDSTVELVGTGDEVIIQSQ